MLPDFLQVEAFAKLSSAIGKVNPDVLCLIPERNLLGGVLRVSRGCTFKVQYTVPGIYLDYLVCNL